jgi:hypothetical protein
MPSCSGVGIESGMVAAFPTMRVSAADAGSSGPFARKIGSPRRPDCDAHDAAVDAGAEMVGAFGPDQLPGGIDATAGGRDPG